MNKTFSNLVKGMLVGATLTAATFIITSKNATKAVKQLAETTSDNISTMFKMN